MSFVRRIVGEASSRRERGVRGGGSRLRCFADAERGCHRGRPGAGAEGCQGFDSAATINGVVFVG